MTDEAWKSFGEAVKAADPPLSSTEVIEMRRELLSDLEGETVEVVVEDRVEVRDRLGRFFLDGSVVFDAPGLYREVMEDMIVFRCEYRADMMMFDYTASSPAFDLVERYTLPPEYMIIWDTVPTEDGEVGKAKQAFRGFQKIESSPC